MPPTYKKPLGRSIAIGSLAFVALLCLVLSIVNYSTYKAGLYRRYESHIRDILNFTRSQIDVDDLAKCLKGKYKSSKFDALQKFMDSFKDSADIHYLYVICPLHDGPVDNVMDIIAAMSSYEKQYMPEMEVQLGGLTGEGYSVETVRKYLNAAKSDGISFFVEDWVKGVTYVDYTGTLPLYTSSGEYLGLLCADIDISEIKRTVMRYTLLNIALILLLGIVFIALFIIWSNHNIASPIKKLENSVTEFAYKQKGKEDIDSIVIEDPEIHTDNEVESLANAVVKMSEDMRSYVESIIAVESKARALDELANKDALTSVRNKNAYDRFVSEMNKKIETQAAKFALVMVDLNCLKRINDNYGHENGNEYIKKSCGVVCNVFEHSPVFRVGGDEFIVILSGRDYEERKSLVQKITDLFKDSAGNESLEPWLRLSAAIGLAEYEPERDKCVDDVFRRADKIMYENKEAMKAVRES